MSTICNQLVYLEISGYQLLTSTMIPPPVIPDDACTVRLLEQQVEGHKEQSSIQKEFSVYGQLVANSMLYRYTHICISANCVCVHARTHMCVV